MLGCLLTSLIASCVNKDGRDDFLKPRERGIMVGNKKYKVIDARIGYGEFILVVPIDSSVSFIPESVTYPKNKSQETTIFVK